MLVFHSSLTEVQAPHLIKQEPILTLSHTRGCCCYIQTQGSRSQGGKGSDSALRVLGDIPIWASAQTHCTVSQNQKLLHLIKLYNSKVKLTHGTIKWEDWRSPN